MKTEGRDFDRSGESAIQVRLERDGGIGRIPEPGQHRGVQGEQAGEQDQNPATSKVLETTTVHGWHLGNGKRLMASSQ